MKKFTVFLIFLGFMVYILWPYNVLEMKDKNPRTTSLIELRRKEAKEKKRKFVPDMRWKNLDHISPSLVHAVVLAEDDRFYEHRGFDLEQTKIALKRNWEKKRYVYGGSTITQQLARTLFLRPKKSIIRKLKEAALTAYLEATLPKRRILELYLNVAEWGPGVYGAEAAAQYFFWKPASELTADEGVALASILPSPRRWSPFSEKAYMAQRRTRLMERMERAGYSVQPQSEESELEIQPNGIYNQPDLWNKPALSVESHSETASELELSSSPYSEKSQVP